MVQNAAHCPAQPENGRCGQRLQPEELLSAICLGFLCELIQHLRDEVLPPGFWVTSGFQDRTYMHLERRGRRRALTGEELSPLDLHVPKKWGKNSETRCPEASRSQKRLTECPPAGAAACKKGAGTPAAPGVTCPAASPSAGTNSRFPRGSARRSASLLPPTCSELPPPPAASTLHLYPRLSGAELGDLSRLELWKWAPDKSTAPPRKMDSRYTSTAGIGDLNQLSAAIPATRVEVSVSCRNLLDRDTFSKSDPICVLYIQGVGNKEWREFGRTEVIDNTLNPDFVRKFILDYFFEERENLRFDLYDVDSKSPNLSKHDFLGQVFCTLGEIVGSQGSRLEKPIVGIPGKKCGTIILTAEELNCCRDAVLMQFCANKLDKKDFFGKSDPFLVFYRSNEDGSFTICHKTEVVKNTLNPVWQAFKISVRALCNGDYDRTIKVQVYDWDRDGSHDFIGEFTTSYRELSRGQSQFNVYEVVNPKKKVKKKKYINSGTVTLLSFLVETEVSFLDYIKGGTQINFTVAIDFTASNAMPTSQSERLYAN
ncbi:Copine-8 [Myotis brandtii]|uniref:Copine-8 n=1 Tax=Myotis brandtii TaxID=109478 RepID=S7NIR0_MYOBR|nr:Copine-8 [Myotis brandtii]